MSIPVFCSYIRRKDMDTVLSCLVTDSIGPGEYLERFQKAAKEAFGYDYGLAFRAPHDALGLALEALGLSAGDAVLLPALAPSYYAHVLRQRGLKPVYYDSAPDSPAAEIEQLKMAIESAANKPKTLLLFYAAGILSDPEALRGLGLPIVEDISQALGAAWADKKAGSVGNLVLLGLEHDSLVTAGGGALLYSTGKRESQVLRNMSEAILPELRLTDYNAALGFAQLRDLASSIERRKEYHTLFTQTLARTRHKVLGQAEEGEPACWALPVLIASGAKEIRAYAKKKEVETAQAFEFSCLAQGFVPESHCTNARSLLLRTILFPVHQRIGVSGAQKLNKVLATLP